MHTSLAGVEQREVKRVLVSWQGSTLAVGLTKEPCAGVVWQDALWDGWA